MQELHQESLNETTKSEQSARVVLWEIDLTAQGGERFFSAMSRMKRVRRSPGKGGSMSHILFRAVVLR